MWSSLLSCVNNFDLIKALESQKNSSIKTEFSLFSIYNHNCKHHKYENNQWD